LAKGETGKSMNRKSLTKTLIGLGTCLLVAIWGGFESEVIPAIWKKVSDQFLVPVKPTINEAEERGHQYYDCLNKNHLGPSWPNLPPKEKDFYIKESEPLKLDKEVIHDINHSDNSIKGGKL
jgi:hypothetical protein